MAQMKVKNSDLRSLFSNLSNRKEEASLKKVRASTGFKPVTSAYCDDHFLLSSTTAVHIYKLFRKVKTTLIGVYLQGKLSGAPSCVLFIPTALIKDQNLTQKIKLGSVNNV